MERKNRKVTYKCPMTLAEKSAYEWREFIHMLMLIPVAGALWGPVVMAWYGGDTLDLWFVVAWSMIASVTMMVTGWIVGRAIAQYARWSTIYAAVEAQPRNRRVRRI